MATYQLTAGRIVALSCIVCTKPFTYTTKSKGRHARFCGDDCRATSCAQQMRATPRKGRTQRKSCARCGAAFSTTSRQRAYCSDECRVDAVRAKLQRTQPSLSCAHCGGVFTKRVRGNDTNQYCSRSCAAARLRPVKSKAIEPHCQLMCVECGVDFKSKRKRITCSAACQSDRVRRQSRLHNAATSGCYKGERPCRECGAAFVPAYGDRRRSFCGDQCAKRAARKKRGPGNDRKRACRAGVYYEPVNRIKVFDRDGWCCQVCGARAPRTLKGSTSPRAPELDHRIPLAMGGPHSYENCQLACRKCNLAKGGHRIVGQLPLFARPKGPRPPVGIQKSKPPGSANRAGCHGEILPAGEFGRHAFLAINRS